MIAQLQAEIEQMQVGAVAEVVPPDAPGSTDAMPVASAPVTLPAPPTSPRVHADVVQEVALLQTIPGVGAVAATTIVAEIGIERYHVRRLEQLGFRVALTPQAVM